MFSKILSSRCLYRSLCFPSARLGLQTRVIGYFSEGPNDPTSKNKNAHPKPTEKPVAEDGYINQATMKQSNSEGEDPKSKMEKQVEGDNEKPMVTSEFGNVMLMGSFALILLSLVYIEIQSVRAESRNKKSMTGNAKVTSSGKAAIGGKWQLTDTNGKPFSSANLDGSYYLIYFGFTNCPDICPNSLTKLSKAVKKVRQSREAGFFDLKSIFVSVDPDRDTSEKIRKFIDLFDPTMIGVTGTTNLDENLRNCMRTFKIYASKIQLDDAEPKMGRRAYTIDHTILTYLMSDDNEYITHLGANMGDNELAKAILDGITEHQKSKMKQMAI